MRRLLIVVAVIAALGATATLTYAAGQKLAAVPPAPVTSAPKRLTVVVPDVRNMAFVFAKQELQDGGFAWRVVGGARGYAANTVVGQSPSAGTRLVDTGAPLVTVTLARNAKYKQAGEAQDRSPYSPTAVRLAGST
jgi:beta-lactam-binding protein with PASTA domain